GRGAGRTGHPAPPGGAGTTAFVAASQVVMREAPPAPLTRLPPLLRLRLEDMKHPLRRLRVFPLSGAFGLEGDGALGRRSRTLVALGWGHCVHRRSRLAAVHC